MVRISEWLPNPQGIDASGEWIELENTGDQTIVLTGWRLINHKSYGRSLQGEIPARGFLVLTKKDFGFALINVNGRLSLADPSGRIADAANFLGAAPEGRSFSREGARFEFGEPTPGQPNIPAQIRSVSREPQPNFHQNIAATNSAGDMVWAAVGAGALLTVLAYYIVKHEPLSDIFFGGNQ